MQVATSPSLIFNHSRQEEPGIRLLAGFLIEMAFGDTAGQRSTAFYRGAGGAVQILDFEQCRSL
jgi:hypothetical protein